ncbi:4076_t:CDS:10 [Diversispora eburnea]|uniref:4076_t:CDS:1 n=1 Tax=Diversispora eburnea TaxID=1213867 RepID=A0A9N9ASW0_9GLOM|nr:4076_t:CDS:10 [Diversispora eburnea]
MSTNYLTRGELNLSINHNNYNNNSNCNYNSKLHLQVKIVDEEAESINNHRYCDVEILCKDGVIVHGIRSILSARSHTIDQILFPNSLKTPLTPFIHTPNRENFEKYIVFQNIDSPSMLFIFNYLYTEIIELDKLTEDNIIDLYYAANYFQLDQLELEIENYFQKIIDNISIKKIPELLSKAISLDNIEVGSLSFNALQCLLSSTKNSIFASSEYSILRYSILICAKIISNYSSPIFEILTPLMEFIDLRRINGTISLFLSNPSLSPSSSSPLSSPLAQIPPPPPTPSEPTITYDFKWSSKFIGSKLKIIENDYVLTSHSYFSSQAARANHSLTNGFHEWDIVLEKLSEYVCIGICGEEYNCSLSYDRNSSQGWYLLVEFKKGTVITVHLDMNSKRLGFSVNGRRFPDLMGWNDFPTKEIDAFTKTILPRHFKHSNFASFVRQLNKYDFHKVRNSDDSDTLYGDQAWEFYHPKFHCSKRDQKTPSHRKNGTVCSNEDPNHHHIMTEQVNKLSTQVNNITELQTNINEHLHTLSTNYRSVVQDLLKLQKNMSDQHQLIQNLVQHLVNLEMEKSGISRVHENQLRNNSSDYINTIPSERAQRLINSYVEIAQSSYDQMNDISRLHRSTFTPTWTVPPKVLLVDDDAVYQNMGSKFLQIFGCSTDIAVDGISAVNKMNFEKYDLVLMDIVLPHLDGVEATTQIRRFDLNTPIISMTSNITSQECIKYYSHGMNDILPKPFTKANLLSIFAEDNEIDRGHDIKRVKRSFVD